MQTFNVKKKHISKAGGAIYKDVGTLVIRDNGKTGVLFLNHLEGEFALFAKEEKEKTSDTPAAAEPAGAA